MVKMAKDKNNQYAKHLLFYVITFSSMKHKSATDWKLRIHTMSYEWDNYDF